MKNAPSPSTPRTVRHGFRPGSSDGFNLVVLAMAVTVLNILLAMALPAWAKMIQREKEEELIFRGLQYAEAIRVFQIRNGRLPTRLTELIEVHPRSIRQLWKNPLAEDGAWLLVPAQGRQRPNQNRQNRNRPNQLQQRLQNRQNQNGRQVQPANQQQVLRVIPPRPGEPVLTPMPNVPFAGVASPEGDTAVKSFMGSTEIREWRFTVNLASTMQQGAQGNFARPVNSGVFWKPFPPGVTPPNLGQAPGAQNQLAPNQNNRRGGRNLGGNADRQRRNN